MPVVPYYLGRPARIWIVAMSGSARATAANPATTASPASPLPAAPSARRRTPEEISADVAQAHAEAEEMDRIYAMNLAMIRKAAQITQVEVARKLEVGQGGLSRMENRARHDRATAPRHRRSGPEFVLGADVGRISPHLGRLAVPDVEDLHGVVVERLALPLGPDVHQRHHVIIIADYVV